MRKINCKFNKDFFYCTNTAVKRSLLGIGPRTCVDAKELKDVCSIRVIFPKPKYPPPPPRPKRNPVTTTNHIILITTIGRI